MTHCLQPQYDALSHGTGVAVLEGRTQIEIGGEDRAKFLNNFCTSDILSLKPGTGTEAFITNVKGKILSHVYVFCRPDRLVLDTVAGQADVLLPHLDRYVIMDDVQLRDATDEWADVLVSGAASPNLLEGWLGIAPPPQRLGCVDADPGGQHLTIARVDYAGANSFFLRCQQNAAPAVVEQLAGAGAVSCGEQAVEVVRVEAGFPLYGRDITDDNLPQEVDRNQQAINLNKGCYLGQETVARLDALGHVNRTLRGVKFLVQEVPPAGTELTAEGKKVGWVTSSVFSPKLNAPLALAYVRTGHDKAGNPLQSPLGKAEVVGLPV